jgi:hypothetical protein
MSFSASAITISSLSIEASSSAARSAALSLSGIFLRRGRDSVDTPKTAAVRVLRDNIRRDHRRRE